MVDLVAAARALGYRHAARVDDLGALASEIAALRVQGGPFPVGYPGKAWRSARPRTADLQSRGDEAGIYGRAALTSVLPQQQHHGQQGAGG